MKKVNLLHDVFRYIYLFMLRMHPREFREEFAVEMDLDFADAMRDGHRFLFYKDGLISLGRQWMLRTAGPQAEFRVVNAPGLLSGRYGMIDADRLTPWELLRGMVVSAALIGGLAMVPAHAVKSLTSPTNAAGMRGEVPGGTGAMTRGGDGEESVGQKRLYERSAFGTRAATPVEVSADPASVAETTAAVLRGTPSQGVPAGTMLVATRKFTAFDVASVRENRSGGDPQMNFLLGPTDAYSQTGGVFRAKNLSLPAYISFAYKLNTFQNSSMRMQVPEWARTTRYDIEARVDGEPTKDDMRAMMRALLADRFNLKVHRETHLMGVMELEMIKPGKTGPTLLVHAADDPECRQNVPAFFSPCGAMGITPTTTVAKMAGRNVSIEDFANFSLIPAGKPVVDKTGLQGKWDITLDFVQDSPGRTADAPPEETGPTFRDALKQQMGLKMVPGQGMVETVVLDGVERPKEN